MSIVSVCGLLSTDASHKAKKNKRSIDQVRNFASITTTTMCAVKNQQTTDMWMRECDEQTTKERKK